MQKNKLLLIFISSYLSSIYVNAQSIYTQPGASIYISGNAVIDAAVSNSPTIFTRGDVENTGNLVNQGEMQLQGNFSNTGTFTSTGDEVFVGTAAQNMSGNLTNANALFNVVVDKTTNPLSLNGNVAVNHQVRFVNGKISVGSNHLSLVPTANFSGQNANNYVQTAGTGTLRQNVGASAVVFPVGNSSYNPVTLSNTGTNDVFSARVADAAGCSGGSLGITNKVNRTWLLSEDVAGGSNATITTQWAAADEDATFLRNQSGIATDAGTTFDLPAINTPANVVSANVFSQTQTGQTLISPRIVTSVDGVTIVGNTTFCNGGSVTLQAPTNAAYSYQWYNNGLLIAGAINNSYVATTSGNYNVYITVNGMCILKTVPVSVNVTPTAPAPTIAFTYPANSSNSLTLCTGSTMVTMNSPTSNVSQYLWYKNGVAANSATSPNNSYTVNTNVTGTDVYQLAVIYNGNTCLSAFSNSLTIVKTIPNAVITPIGPTTFCANTPTALQANTGTNYSYVWKRGNLVVQVGGASYIPTASGNYQVVVKDGNTGCSKVSAIVNLTQNPIPLVTAGIGMNACNNTPITIGPISVSTATNTYTWSPTTNVSNPYAQNTTVTLTSVGTLVYTLTITNYVTGCSNNIPFTINSMSNPTTPSLTSTNTPICQGSSVSVSPTNLLGANSVDWYKNGIFLYSKSTTYSEVVTVPSATADNYTIKSKSINGCLSNFSNAKSVWVKEAATPTISSLPIAVSNVVKVCVPNGTSGNATLTGNSTTASPTYSWKLAGNFIAGANANTYTANVTPLANNKVFSVQATYPNGCVKTSANVTVQLVTFGCTPVKLDEGKAGNVLISLDEISMSAFPNPTQGELNIQIANVQENEGTIFLYNALGQIVEEQSISFSEGKADIQLDMKNIAIGIYTLSLQSGNVQKTLKVVKE